MLGPTGATQVFGVAGDPVAHSLSPTLHNAAFRSLGVDAVSIALRASERDAAVVVDAVRRLGVRGLSVTMPLKAAVVEHCDERASVVELLGASNCLARTAAGGVRAESTDGDGLVAAIACVAHRDVRGLRCAVLGGGGAARAAVVALAAAGATEVVVIARSEDQALRVADLASAARVGAPQDVAGLDLVVQATPVGMLGTTEEQSSPLVEPTSLRAGQVAVDLVYHPRVTPWLARAASSGASVVGGVEVLVHQSAAALSIWLGVPAPLEVLHAAVAAP
ncbi:MAG TPA: NAD(P)-dependent oxidoreductase [Acidimicrobiales bacterium]|nr:NAD(P)-dependent oxidoreductase [Acidimicrobiales bacterium]